MTIIFIISVTYFDGANDPVRKSDGTIRFHNTGFTAGTLCSMVYVFDANQEMTECCGCALSHDALKILSVNNDLTSNPLTGIKPNRGVIKVVSADQATNPSCDPTAITPAGALLFWATHIQTFGSAAFLETEDNTQISVLGDEELANLQSQCAFASSLGSGQGICSCGAAN